MGSLKKEIIGKEFQNDLHLIVNVDLAYIEIWLVSYHLFCCCLFKYILVGVGTFYFTLEKIISSNKICYFPKSNRNGVIDTMRKCKFTASFLCLPPGNLCLDGIVFQISQGLYLLCFAI